MANPNIKFHFSINDDYDRYLSHLEEIKSHSQYEVPFFMGFDSNNQAQITELPHSILIAGSTGSGKSGLAYGMALSLIKNHKEFDYYFVDFGGGNVSNSKYFGLSTVNLKSIENIPDAVIFINQLYEKFSSLNNKKTIIFLDEVIYFSGLLKKTNPEEEKKLQELIKRAKEINCHFFIINQNWSDFEKDLIKRAEMIIALPAWSESEGEIINTPEITSLKLGECIIFNSKKEKSEILRGISLNLKDEFILLQSLFNSKIIYKDGDRKKYLHSENEPAVKCWKDDGTVVIEQWWLEGILISQVV